MAVVMWALTVLIAMTVTMLGMPHGRQALARIWDAQKRAFWLLIDLLYEKKQPEAEDYRCHCGVLWSKHNAAMKGRHDAQYSGPDPVKSEPVWEVYRPPKQYPPKPPGGPGGGSPARPSYAEQEEQRIRAAMAVPPMIIGTMQNVPGAEELRAHFEKSVAEMGEVVPLIVNWDVDGRPIYDRRIPASAPKPYAGFVEMGAPKPVTDFVMVHDPDSHEYLGGVETCAEHGDSLPCHECENEWRLRA